MVLPMVGEYVIAFFYYWTLSNPKPLSHDKGFFYATNSKTIPEKSKSKTIWIDSLSEIHDILYIRLK